MTLYKVQTGAFAIKRNAEKQAAKVIAALGIRTTIIREGLIYKVQCGAFSQYGNAVTMANKLRGAGFSAVIKLAVVEIEPDDKKDTLITTEHVSGLLISWMKMNHNMVMLHLL